jgi:hypothetical protein
LLFSVSWLQNDQIGVHGIKCRNPAGLLTVIRAAKHAWVRYTAAGPTHDDHSDCQLNFPTRVYRHKNLRYSNQHHRDHISMQHAHDLTRGPLSASLSRGGLSSLKPLSLSRAASLAA